MKEKFGVLIKYANENNTKLIKFGFTLKTPMLLDLIKHITNPVPWNTARKLRCTNRSEQ